MSLPGTVPEISEAEYRKVVSKPLIKVGPGSTAAFCSATKAGWVYKGVVVKLSAAA